MAVTTWTWTKQEDGTSKNVASVKGEGMTVGQGSSYIGDGDSSYWAVVAVPRQGEEFDGEGFTFERVYTGYTPGDTTIDAPAWVMEQYQAEVAAKAQAAREAAAKARAEREALEAYWESQEPKRGRTVRVVRGRKVPVGTEAEVAWYGESQYGGYRVGLTIGGERVYTSASNVEVISPAPLPQPVAA